ncbi:MAG: SDR family oxidoreductase [Christensenellaceae bacterium]|nr:SDR family oxidoreductase [Christensenellaceae bacterium]
MTKSMALDWAKKGVRVNIIMPGTFKTPLLQACIDKDPTYGDKWIKMHPVGRFGEPKEIAGIAIYLASDASTYMTGNVIYVDGGGHAGKE